MRLLLLLLLLQSPTVFWFQQNLMSLHNCTNDTVTIISTNHTPKDDNHPYSSDEKIIALIKLSININSPFWMLSYTGRFCSSNTSWSLPIRRCNVFILLYHKIKPLNFLKIRPTNKIWTQGHAPVCYKSTTACQRVKELLFVQSLVGLLFHLWLFVRMVVISH